MADQNKPDEIDPVLGLVLSIVGLFILIGVVYFLNIYGIDAVIPLINTVTFFILGYLLFKIEKRLLEIREELRSSAKG